jgi:ribosomal protein S18 acetylase RimI-like enzyme
MGVVIRNMKVDDMSDVKRVDLLAWTALVESKYPEIKKLAPRTDENIVSYLHSDPEGAFVAVDEFAGIVGSTFSHAWGRVGWVGPISVVPSYQGRGIGKELARASFEYLDEEGCTDIGLETMPENQLNLGMYLRIGLKPVGLVLIMGRSLTDQSPPAGDEDDMFILKYSENPAKKSLISQIKRVSDSLQPGLDYSPEVMLTDEYSFGDTLVAFRRDKVVGFSVVQTSPRRVDMQGASVRALAIDPSEGNAPFGPLIRASESLAAGDRSAEIAIPVPHQCHRAVDALLSRGYSVVQAYERMMWLGSPGLSENAYNLSSWSG